MTVAIIVLVLVLIGALLIVLFRRKSAREYKRTGTHPADIAIVNAKVFTSNDAQLWAQAVAVKDERITYVGDDDGVADYIGPDTKIIDAKERMLTPGFLDNHCHVLWIGGLTAFMPLLYEAKSVDDVKKIVREFAEKHPDYPFIMAVGWNYDYIPNWFPTKEMADEILSDRPLFMMSYGGETGWLNSLAFERVKRYPEALKPFPLPKDDNGNETGLLYKFYAFNPFEYFEDDELPDDIWEHMYNAMEKTLNEALQCGITTMNDVQIYKKFIPQMLEFHKRGKLDNVRLRGSFYISHIALEDEEGLKKDLQEWIELGKQSDDHLLLGDSVKFYIEGVANNYTTLMLEPFNDKPDCYGEALWTQEDFDRVIEIIDGMGLQACTHSCGDGGVRRVINSYEKAQRKNKHDARHRVEHCSLIATEDIKRMGELDIHAAMQPCHFWGGPSNEKLFGHERMQRAMPWRSLEKAGVNVSFGSDWCAGPMDPVYGLIISANRMNYKLKEDWGPDEKITVENAIKHYTIDCAKSFFLEDKIGSIEVGKFGDFAMFNIDLKDLTSTMFLMTQKLEYGGIGGFVDMTIVGGNIVYQK